MIFLDRKWQKEMASIEPKEMAQLRKKNPQLKFDLFQDRLTFLVI